jgi:hypothetical protein
MGLTRMPFFPSTTQTSSTYQFYPSTAEIIVTAFSRIKIKRTELTEQHVQDGIMEFNLYLATFNDLGPNLAQVDLQSIPLVQATATYAILPETVTILDVYLRFGSPPTDKYLYSISRTEYAAIPNKASQGPPSQYWFDRTIAPTINLYLTPDGGGPYTLFYYRFRRVQDATAAGGIVPEVPNRAMDCLVAGLAHRLSRTYAPELEQLRKMDAAEAWAIYAKQDTENVPMYILPGTSGYWRV